VHFFVSSKPNLKYSKENYIRMALGIEYAFLILGGLIIIGYFGELLSRKITVPIALLLLFIGFGLKLTGLVDAQDFVGIQAIFGTLALIVLLFDGGMSLNIYEAVFKSGRSLTVGFMSTIFGTVLVALLFFVVGLNPLIGAIIGAIVGGIDTGITLSITKSMTIPEKVKNFLTIESSSNDVLSIILALVLTQALIFGALDVQVLAQGIVGKFAIGIFVGLIVGIASTLSLARIEQGYNYMVTLAIVLLLFSVTEFLNGSGAIAVLVFGIILGNESVVRGLIHSREVKSYPIVQQFQAEVSFFIRTFFFVFLGIIVTLGSLTNFAIALAIMALLYFIRYVIVHFATLNTDLSKYKRMLIAINPRGLTTAVLATYPLILIENAINTNPSPALESISSQISILSEIAFYLIVVSVILTSILLPLSNNIKEPVADSEKTLYEVKI